MTIYLHDAQIPRVTDAETGLPIGPVMKDAGPALRPGRVVLEGRYCRLEPIEPERHREELFRASTPPDAARRFRYLFEAAPQSIADIDAWLAKARTSLDPLVFAVIDKRTGRCEGRQTLMRITPEQRCIEIGSIYWGPAISQTPVTTEANFLFATYVFEDLGYRRFEWKCDALNAPSRRAAERFGFTYEGLFRRAVMVKGRSRDTTWFAMVEDDWPVLKAAYERWLDPANFDGEGRQRTSLGDLTAAALGRTLPLTLRRATDNDLAAVVALQQAAYASNRAVLGVEPLPLKADYAAIFQSMEVWLADGAGGLDGVLILEPRADDLLIWSVATDPRQQSGGLGRRMIAWAEGRARQLGRTTMRLYTGSLLTDRVAWYARHGYETERIEQMPDRSTTHMVKRL